MNDMRQEKRTRDSKGLQRPEYRACTRVLKTSKNGKIAQLVLALAGTPKKQDSYSYHSPEERPRGKLMKINISVGVAIYANRCGPGEDNTSHTHKNTKTPKKKHTVINMETSKNIP